MDPLLNSQTVSSPAQITTWTHDLSTPSADRIEYTTNDHEDEFVLIIGGLGGAGMHVCWENLRDGHNIIIVDQFSKSKQHSLEALCRLRDAYYLDSGFPPIVDFYESDYRNQAPLRSILTLYEDFAPSYTSSPSPFRSRVVEVIHCASPDEETRHEWTLEQDAELLASLKTTLADFKIRRLVCRSLEVCEASLLSHKKKQATEAPNYAHAKATIEVCV